MAKEAASTEQHRRCPEKTPRRDRRKRQEFPSLCSFTFVARVRCVDVVARHRDVLMLRLVDCF